MPGKRSPDGKFREYRFSREVISALKPKLEAKGFTVFVDMPADEVPSPQAKELSLRCKYVNGICKTFGNDNCIYVSIHVNAAGSESKWLNASGFSVFVCNNCSAASKRLAQSLYAEAAARGLQGNRSVPTCRYGSANFYVGDGTGITMPVIAFDGRRGAQRQGISAVLDKNAVSYSFV